MAEPNNDKDITTAIDRVRNKQSTAEKPMIDWSGLGNAVLNFLLSPWYPNIIWGTLFLMKN